MKKAEQGVFVNLNPIHTTLNLILAQKNQHGTCDRD